MYVVSIRAALALVPEGFDILPLGMTAAVKESKIITMIPVKNIAQRA